MEPSVSLGDLQASEPLISLRKQSRKQRRPHPLTRFVRDEVLANFECHMVQVPLLAKQCHQIAIASTSPSAMLSELKRAVDLLNLRARLAARLLACGGALNHNQARA